MQTSRRYQDIAIINNDRRCPENGSGDSKKTNPCVQILVVITLAVIIFAGGYVIGVHTGHIPADEPICCVGVLDLDLDFDFDGGA